MLEEQFRGEAYHTSTEGGPVACAVACTIFAEVGMGGAEAVTSGSEAIYFIFVGLSSGALVTYLLSRYARGM